MIGLRCPGQDPRFMRAGDVKEAACPECGHVVEFWPDELVRKCRACGHRFPNPQNAMKCLDWCRYAAQCMAALRGEDEAWVGPLREELLERMRGAFGEDRRRVKHAEAVLELAEAIGRETGADPLVLVPAAIFHDIGRAGCCGTGQADHGPAGRKGASELLGDLNIPLPVLAEILDTIEHHHERDWMDRPNGRALFDADLIVNLQERGDRGGLAALEERALTEAGRRIGKARLAS